MQSGSAVQAVGIFGGSFDPIHLGHLRTALELLERLPLGQIRFVPCQQPVHKPQTLASAVDRLAMLKLALAGERRFSIDTRELNRATPSYMFETLMAIRQENPNTPLCLICSTDAFLNFTQWHRYREILDLAHLVVATRQGYEIDQSKLDELLRQRLVLDTSQLAVKNAGSIYLVDTTPLAISSTAIRHMIKNGLSPRYLIPDKVRDYIINHSLYQ